MTTTSDYPFVSADEAAAAFVQERIARYDGITIEYDPHLTAPYLVHKSERLVVLPDGVPWRIAHARLNRAWLFLKGGAALAPEFAPIGWDHPDMPIAEQIGPSATVIPLLPLRRPW